MIICFDLLTLILICIFVLFNVFHFSLSLCITLISPAPSPLPAVRRLTNHFSIELHKANLLGLEVQYYPYPAPLNPFPNPLLSKLPTPM